MRQLPSTSTSPPCSSRVEICTSVPDSFTTSNSRSVSPASILRCSSYLPSSFPSSTLHVIKTGPNSLITPESQEQAINVPTPTHTLVPNLLSETAHANPLLMPCPSSPRLPGGLRCLMHVSCLLVHVYYHWYFIRRTNIKEEKKNKQNSHCYNRQ